MATKLIITDFLLPELEDEFAKRHLERFRARQTLRWIYRHNAESFDDMTDLPIELRQGLKKSFEIFSTKVKSRLTSSDGTQKFLIELFDHNIIETVLISDNARKTVCISTQVGCPIQCKFCASGMDGFVRNLKTSEIVEQVLHIKQGLPVNYRVSSLVIMGTGEPLLNLDNVQKALKIFNASWGLAIGYNKITLSTVGSSLGNLNKIRAQKVVPNLALSIHAPNDKIRRLLIPRLPARIDEIIKAGALYRKSTGKECTFEYVLIAGINASKENALELGNKLKGKKCKVNVIPYNKIPKLPYREPSKETLDEFVKTLGSCGVPVTVRKNKGADLNAACGQLRARFK